MKNLKRSWKMTFRCLFEQSGTFKNVFKEFGHNAFDYDILNDYGETDFQIDLFREIEIEYDFITNGEMFGTFKNENHGYGNRYVLGLDGKYRLRSIFRDMKPETDFIIAFFPCTYFTDLNELQFRLIKSRSEPVFDKPNIERILQRNKNRAYSFEIWIKFCFVCHYLNIPTIIENPVGNNRRNYLKLYSPFQPKWIEENRTKFGDKFKKPTYFFAINFEMKENFQMFDKEYFGLKTIQNVKGKDRQRERSEMTPRYARNFYKRFIENYVKEKNNEQI